MKPSVYDAADGKFNGRYHRRTHKTAQNKALAFHIHIDDVYEQKCEAARYRHCPVSVAPEKHLDEPVCYAADTENSEKFNKFSLQKNHL